MSTIENYSKYDKVKELKELTDRLDKYRESYYNNNQSLISDKEYDELYDKVEQLEQETGVIFNNSPTQNVGYVVQDKLKKVKHDHPMLSLGKTKDVADVIKFAGDKTLIVMMKMDGLTCSLHYNESGDLVSAETRGNGEIGEDIFNNAKALSNIPLKINNDGVPLTIDGEVIVDYDEFIKINAELSEDKKFSHPRNLAAGSIRQLDTKITAARHLKFIPWRVISGTDNWVNNNMFCDTLSQAIALGFEVVPYKFIPMHQINENDLPEVIHYMQEWAEKKGYPIDGLVFSYEDMEYGNRLGATGHHPLHSLAFKFYDDVYKTTLRDIEWDVGRTGTLTPVAIFDEVDLDGAITKKATLHNVSYIKELNLGIGDEINVFRANSVIPKVKESLTKSNNIVFPTMCPCCSTKLVLHQNKTKENGVEKIVENLFCENPDCSSKQLAKFKHFVSKACMNIDGLNEKSLEVLLETGMVTKYADIYHLSVNRNELLELERWGDKKVDNLLKAIETSRKVPFANFIFALGIPLIGKEASKVIAKAYKNLDNFMKACETKTNFAQLEDFGKTMSKSVIEWYTNLDKQTLIQGIFDEVEIIEDGSDDTAVENDFIAGKIFVVTGSFNTMKRSEIEKIITDRGGKLSGSVSKKTNYLLTNDGESGSSKAVKAKELNIPIMSEEEFLSKIN